MPPYISILLIAVTLVVLISGVRAFSARRAGERTFSGHPKDYHEKVVTIEGSVKRILPDTFFERTKRKITDVYRTAIDSPDFKNRYSHQRFILSSPQLRFRSQILVEHNRKFGEIRIRKGTKLRVTGIYLHTVNRRRHRYGRIHYTHAPHGKIDIL